MAIHNDYPGLTVEVFVNGEAVPRYDALAIRSKPEVVTKYIQVKAGDEFSVRYRVERHFPKNAGISIRSHVDGNYIGRKSLDI